MEVSMSAPVQTKAENTPKTTMHDAPDTSLSLSTSLDRIKGKRWTVAFFVLLGIWFLAVYSDDFLGVVGRWFLSANEAYLVALVVPLFWEIVAPSTMSGRSGFSPLAVRVFWYGTFLVALIMLEGPAVKTMTGSRLPQEIITLRDVVVGLFGLSIYFDWSRGLWRARDTGNPQLVSATKRLIFFAVLLAANIAIFLDPVADLLGPRLTTWLDFHAEAFAVMFFIPIYFDIVLHFTNGDPVRARAGKPDGRSAAIVVGAIALMLFFVWAGQGAARTAFDNNFGQWFVRSAEAPLGAIGIILYFEILRRLDRRTVQA